MACSREILGHDKILFYYTIWFIIAYTTTYGLSREILAFDKILQCCSIRLVYNNVWVSAEQYQHTTKDYLAAVYDKLASMRSYQ